MPRPLWSGAVSFGLVNVPVALFSGVRDLNVRFNQLHGKDGARIDIRRFCAEEDREISYDEVGRGFDLDEQLVVLDDEELAAAAPKRTRTIEIEAFVDVEEVDPILFDHPYILAPTGEADGNLRAYRLLVEALAGTERAGLGRFVMRTKEYLVLLRSQDERLTLTTMRFHDEVRPTKPVPTGGKKPTKKQLDEAVALVEALATEWDPANYDDCYRERLKRVIDSKRKRRRIEVPKPEPEPQPVPDLMEALQRAVENVRAGRDVRTQPESENGGDGDLDALSRDELVKRAKEKDIPGRSKMSKKELVEALSE
jgi:DNA end-binding protein Ku